MRTGQKNMLSAIIGCLVLAVTVGGYLLLPYEKGRIDRLTLAGTIIAQILGLAAVMIFNRAAGKRKLFLSAGGYSAVFIYLLASIAAAAAFAFQYRTAPRTYLLLAALMTAAFIIALIFIYWTGSKVAAEGARTEAGLYSFKTTESNLDLIRLDPKNAAYRSQLDQIYESYKNCDQSNYILTDEKITQRLYDLNRLLQQRPSCGHEISELCDLILQLIRQRSLEVSQMKLGGV